MMYRSRWFLVLVVVSVLQAPVQRVCAAEVFPVSRDPQVRIRLLTHVADPSRVCRISKDPRDNTLYYMTLGGFIYRLDVQPGENQSRSVKVAGPTDHGQTNTMGFDIGPDGTFYVVANQTSASNDALTSARVLRGVPVPATGGWTWSTVAVTDEYARSKTAFDHVFNAVEVSPDGGTLYLNSGSRTDHGEIQDAGGQFPGLREEALTSAIFRVPSSADNLRLPRDLVRLRAEGRIFCEGIRNTFDLRFSPRGELFGTENGPDRHMSEELNWLREGRHYGFPWRMGGADNPQQFPGYNPALDKLLDIRFTAVKGGYFYNDPTFPPAPVNLTEPIRNLGPDADKYRDPADGEIKDASDLGVPMATFSAHRSPLGMVFDEDRAMAPPYQGDAFVMGFMDGDENGAAYAGPFKDASEDLLHVRLEKVGDGYEARVYKVVTGFNNPIDSEVIGNRIFVVSYGTPFSVWEITFPEATDKVQFSQPEWTEAGLVLELSVPQAGSYALETSTNLVDWKPLWTRVLAEGSLVFLDGTASRSSGARYYRTSKP